MAVGSEIAADESTHITLSCKVLDSTRCIAKLLVMTPRHGAERASPDPEPLHRRAAEDLSFIRDTMARTVPFTAVPGWGGFIMGLTALPAAWFASGREVPAEWLAVWLAEAVIALGIGGVAFVRKAERTQTPILSMAGKQFVGNFAPPVVAGALLTPVLYHAGLTEHLAGLWLLLYGTGVTTAGAFSIRVVPVLGITLMALGGLALVVAPAFADLFMAVGFGGVQIVFGLVIARKYGG